MSTNKYVIGKNSTDVETDVEDVANELFTSLTSELPSIPSVDLTGDDFSFDPNDGSVLYSEPEDIVIDDLTEGTLKGEGAFDRLMASVDRHINREFKDNRITGDQYAQVYTQVITNVLGNATQFVLTKDQARWQGIQAQMQARVAEIQATSALVELERIRLDTARSAYETQTAAAQFALAKLNIANAEEQFSLLEQQTARERYTNEFILPTQLAQEQHNLNCTLPLQTRLAEEQVEAAYAQTMDTRTDCMTPVTGLIGRQKLSLSLDNETKQFQLDHTLPAQLNILAEQRESERARTLDTRTDGEIVVGSIGKQNDLLDQQIDSFEKDAKHRTARMYLDGWITQKTLDEGLLAPDQLTNANIDQVLESIRLANSL